MKLGHADSHGRKLIQHLFAEGRKSTDGSVVFRLAEVAGVLRIDAKVANQTLSRLRQGGLVERLDFKNGPGGYSVLRLPEVVYHLRKLKNNRNSSTSFKLDSQDPSKSGSPKMLMSALTLFRPVTPRNFTF